MKNVEVFHIFFYLRDINELHVANPILATIKQITLLKWFAPAAPFCKWWKTGLWGKFFSFLLHFYCLSSSSFRKLICNNNQAQIDHKEGSNLQCTIIFTKQRNAPISCHNIMDRICYDWLILFGFKLVWCL